MNSNIGYHIYPIIMGYTCCVFGCKFNYQYLRKDKRETLFNVTILSFPESESLRKEWIKNIPNRVLKITESTRVCIIHFHKDDVITQDIFPRIEGEPDIIVNIDNNLIDLYIKGITITGCTPNF